MSKYETLLKVLDQIRREGSQSGYSSYGAPAADIELANQSRARAYIHLFLKVKFGLLDFKERESFVTDGSQDGGIDGYFIDRDVRTIYFLQSKFRTNEKNFLGKKIDLEEIARMDVARISSGETKDERGVNYNGKIQGLIRTISEIEDIGRYKYKVVIIANLGDLAPAILKNICGGFPVEIFGAERCYSELIFPVLSGTYFQKEHLSIWLDLSKKSAGAKINYGVSLSEGSCEITVLFVPTLEIAKTMFKYRNAILKHNPRSYLEFEGAPVNTSIRSSILDTSSNEFALLNNGITMISDDTNINEKIGQKNKAQLFVANPQIINGGQTAYTLSRLYEENLPNAEEVFGGKEVLLKVITLTDSKEHSSAQTADLIDKISTATNRQTAVTNSDRHSNEEGFAELQKVVFDKYGVLFERKRGEFSDGIKDGYLEADQILDRNVFAKIVFASNGYLSDAVARRSFMRLKDPRGFLAADEVLDRFYFGYRYFKAAGSLPLSRKNRGSVGKLFAFVLSCYRKDYDAYDFTIERLSAFDDEWLDFSVNIRGRAPDKKGPALGFEKQIRDHFSNRVIRIQ